MGIKGELGGGFPQLEPAFIITMDWDPAHMLGPTTQPKNHLSYIKLHGTVKSVHDSSFPPFAADFVDAGAWIQQEVLPSGETWFRSDVSTLLRVVEPPNTSADPAVAETETGLIRLKWSGVGTLPGILTSALEKDIPELNRAISREGKLGGFAITYSFQTGDQCYKYLEHAVYVGKSRIVVAPAEGAQEVRKPVYEMKVSYLAA